MDLLDRLIEHDIWATDTLFDVCATLTDEQLDQSFDVGHRTIRDTWDHMIFNIAAWTGVMMGQRPDDPRDQRSLTDLRTRSDRAYANFTSFARSIRDGDRFDDIFIDHFDGEQTFGAAILHVILHNEGHRVELLHILNRLGVPNIPEIDHALWDFVRRGLFVSPDEAGSAT